MQIEIATQVTEELIEAFNRLIPQLSSSATIPTRHELEDLIASRCNSVILVRHEDFDNRIMGTLTLVTFRIPTGVRSWIEDVVVDEAARGKGLGKALTLAALDQARKLGAKTVDLTSRPSREAANHMYQNVGFKLRESNLYRFTL
jgi:ribosomal protein S18 acetylase RimI-like enzyme